MKKINVCLVLTLIFFTSHVFSKELKKKERNIKEINRSIIYDLFLNMELTNRNLQIAVLYDYIPHFDKKTKIKSVKINANMKGDYKEDISLLYEKNNRLKNVNYKVQRSIHESPILFKYTLNYKENRLSTIYIKSRLLYKFLYNSKGKLKSIKHFLRDGIVRIYNVQYKKDNRINFSLDVIKNDDVYFNTNNSRDFIILNKENRITQLNFDTYNFEDIMYSNNKNIVSFKFSKNSKKGVVFEWNYSKFDDQKNWIERSKGKYSTKRELNYK